MATFKRQILDCVQCDAERVREGIGNRGNGDLIITNSNRTYFMFSPIKS